MSVRRTRWLAAGVTSALAGVMLQAGVQAAQAGVMLTAARAGVQAVRAGVMPQASVQAAPAGVQATRAEVIPQGGVQAAPAGMATGRNAAARDVATGGRLKVSAGPSLETIQGIAMTLPLPGTGGAYLRLNSLGAAGASAPDGRVLWQLPAGSLFADWHLTLTSKKDGPVKPNPQVPLVRESPSPFKIANAQQHGIADMHPAAAGYLRGIRQPVAVIAETAGAQVGSVNLQWPFHVPGSHRHEGSFVTVLNGLTGQIGRASC